MTEENILGLERIELGARLVVADAKNVGVRHALEADEKVAVTGGSGRSSRVVREETGRSVAAEGRDGVAVCELKLACELKN